MHKNHYKCACRYSISCPLGPCILRGMADMCGTAGLIRGRVFTEEIPCITEQNRSALCAADVACLLRESCSLWFLDVAALPDSGLFSPQNLGRASASAAFFSQGTAPAPKSLKESASSSSAYDNCGAFIVFFFSISWTSWGLSLRLFLQRVL